MPVVSSTPSRERRSSTKPNAWTRFSVACSRRPVSQPIRSRGVRRDTVLARYVRTEATLRGDHLSDERYFTATVRPTVELARDIACLVNQLLEPPVAELKQEPAPTENPSAVPAEIVVIAPPRPCSVEYSDGHWESLVLRVGGAVATSRPALSRGDAGRLEALLPSALDAPFLK